MAFLYCTQHSHAHAFLQSFGAVGVDHRHCQLARLCQKNAVHGVCIWDCCFSTKVCEDISKPKRLSWKQSKQFPKISFLSSKCKVFGGRNSATFYLENKLLCNSRSIVICLMKGAIFSTMVLALWFSVNNSKSLEREASQWEVWAKETKSLGGSSWAALRITHGRKKY